MTESSLVPRRRTISIREVMGLIVLAALACVWPGLIPTEVLVILFWLPARRGSEDAKARLVSLGVILSAVYLVPLGHFWLATISHPALHGAEWRADWSPYFPIAPAVIPAWQTGGLIELALPGLRSSITLAYAITSIFAAAWVYLLTLLAGQSRVRRAIAATVGLICAALGTYAITLLVFLMPT